MLSNFRKNQQFRKMFRQIFVKIENFGICADKFPKILKINKNVMTSLSKNVKFRNMLGQTF